MKTQRTVLMVLILALSVVEIGCTSQPPGTAQQTQSQQAAAPIQQPAQAPPTRCVPTPINGPVGDGTGVCAGTNQPDFVTRATAICNAHGYDFQDYICGANSGALQNANVYCKTRC